ncbi:MAG: ABC transporter permease [Acidobacteriia bacterium]|nr:ABC transporter permease [Terriglobia bacterium]
MNINLRESAIIALNALNAHKLRSILTLVGVIIGVTTVIAVVSIVQGLDSYVKNQVLQFGSDTFTVQKFPNFVTSFEEFLEYNKRRDLTLDDMKAIEERCNLCKAVAGIWDRSRTVKFGMQSIEDVDIRGVSVNAPFMGQVMELASGRHFTETDVDHVALRVIIGADLAEKLFYGRDPLGLEVKIDGIPFEIIGVAKKTGSFFGQSMDNFARIPITMYQRMYGSHESLFINVQAPSEAQLPQAMDEVRVIMRARQHTPYKKEDGFALETAASFIDLWQSFSQGIFAVTISIASIALIVGGVVIMNIMLVSVRERTREIGIRKAIGARRRDILLQFLIEAVTLAGSGGLLGALLGIAIALILSKVSPLPAVIRWWSILMGIGMASSVGLFFGIYPASRAAKLDPIVALRFE